MSTNEGLVRDLRKIESRTGEYRTEAQTLAAEAARSAALHALASSKLEEASLAIHEVFTLLCTDDIRLGYDFWFTLFLLLSRFHIPMFPLLVLEAQ